MKEAQILAVCELLCRYLRKGEAYWTVKGGSPACVEVLEGRSPWSHGEQIVIKVAWVLWGGGVRLDLAEIVETLGGRWLRLIGSLLVAMSTEGAGQEAAIDQWLQENHLPGPPFTCSRCGPIYIGDVGALSHANLPGHVVTRTAEPLAFETVGVLETVEGHNKGAGRG